MLLLLVAGIPPPNILADSEEAESWSYGNASALLNTTGGPAAVGGTTADQLVEDTVNTQHYVQRLTASSVSGTYTASCYVKPNGRTIININLNASGGGSGAYSNYDLGTSALNFSGNYGVGITYVGSGIEDAGGGWRRVWTTATVTSPVQVAVVVQLENGAGNTYAGDGVSGVFFVGGQINAGSLAPYQRTQTPSSALVGTLPGVSGFSGALTGDAALSGTLTGLSTFSGTLTGLGSLSGTLPGVSGFSGSLVNGTSLSGVLPGSSGFAGSLSGLGNLVGVMSGSSGFSGSLSGLGDLAGSLPGSSAFASTLRGSGALVGTLPGQSSFAAAGSAPAAPKRRVLFVAL